jgi:hypothetical protein
MFLSNINSLSEILAARNLNQETAELIQGVYITGTGGAYGLYGPCIACSECNELCIGKVPRLC